MITGHAPRPGPTRPVGTHRARGVLLLMATVFVVTAAGGWDVAAADAATTSTPFIQVAPNPPLDSREVRVFGRDFCPDPDCSPATIWLDGRRVVTDVPVDADGRFVTRLSLQTLPGERVVAATQTASDGAELRAETTVVVPTIDYIEDPASPTQEPSATADEPADAEQTDDDASGPSPADGADGDPTEQSTDEATSSDRPLPPVSSPAGVVDEERNPVAGWALAIIAGLALYAAILWWRRRSPT